jgi:TPR repeat protein
MSSDKKAWTKNDIRHSSDPRVEKGRDRLRINSKSLLVPSARENSLYKKAFDLSRRRGNAERVAALLQESHRQGDVRATYALATWHIHGANLPRNRGAGIKLLRKASKGGIREARFDLGHAYEMGIGVTKSYEKALNLYIEAAQKGDHDAVAEVIRCVFYGKGIPRNKELAYLIRDLHEGRRRG